MELIKTQAWHAACMLSRSVASNSETPCTVAHQALLSMGFSAEDPGVGYHFLLQGFFLYRDRIEDAKKYQRRFPLVAACWLEREVCLSQMAQHQRSWAGKLETQTSLSQSFSHSGLSNSCDPMDHSTPGFPVHHQLPELTQTHVHLVSDAIHPSHALSFPSPLAFNLSQHQGLFQ